MLRSILYLATFILTFQNLSAQWQYGVNIQETTTTPFSWSEGPEFESARNSGFELWIEYRFAERTKGPFKLQDGLRIDWQVLSRNATVNNANIESQWLRLPIWWTNTLPRYLKDEKHPIFELNSGLGYYFAKPIYTAINGFSGSEKQHYSSHGFLGEFGLTFYIQTGSRINLNYRVGWDLGKTGIAPTDFPLQFMERGLTIGFSSSFSDTKIRLTAMKAARKQRRKK